jgi:hypothetical protein
MVTRSGDASGAAPATRPDVSWSCRRQGMAPGLIAHGGTGPTTHPEQALVRSTILFFQNDGSGDSDSLRWQRKSSLNLRF